MTIKVVDDGRVVGPGGEGGPAEVQLGGLRGAGEDGGGTWPQAVDGHVLPPVWGKC